MKSSLIAALLYVVLSGFAFSNVAIADGLTAVTHDDFKSDQHPNRKALRGDWTFSDGIAHVIQDDELFKKFKNHGPIINYTIDHSNISVVVEFKPKGCERVVFTLDAEKGHAFRVTLRSPESKKGASTIHTYTEKQANGKAKPIILRSDVPRLKNDTWHRLEVSISGGKATVKIADQYYEVEHPRIDQQKKVGKLSFAHGELSIRKFDLDEVE